MDSLYIEGEVNGVVGVGTDVQILECAATQLLGVVGRIEAGGLDAVERRSED